MRKKWLSRNLAVLSLVSLFQDAASEMLYPILPIFLTSVLGAPVEVVGAIEGLAEGIASLMKIVSGRLADRMQRKPLVGLGYSLAATAKIVIAFANAWPVVLIGRALDRTGKGIRGTPRDALIADDVDPEFRGHAFGFHRALDTLGAVIGPAIGLGIYELLNHKIRPLLVIAIIPAVISPALVFLVRERPAPREVKKNDSVDSPLGRNYWQVVTTLALFSVVNFPDALLLLRAKYLGFSVAAVIGAYILYNASYSLLSYPAGALSDRWSRKWLIAAGTLVFGVSYLSLGIVHARSFVWVIFIFYGGFTALTDGVGKAWITDLSNTASRGRAMGIHQGLIGFGSIAAGIWAGLAWHRSGVVPLHIAGIAGIAISFIVLLLPSRQMA